jgi:hypothetical protein
MNDEAPSVLLAVPAASLAEIRTEAPDDARLALIALLRFGALLAAFWCVFYATWAALPYVRAGATIIYDSKIAIEQSGTIFPRPDRENIIIFGNSKVLSGFVPGLFDGLYKPASGRPSSSFNMGLPDAEHFVSDLELMAARGQVPSQILITVPWSTARPASILRFLDHDSQTMERLFPFRKLPRDLILFFLRSAMRGGIAGSYEQGRANAARIELDRGYYYIEGQSHYAGGRLPDAFRLESDAPDRVEMRAGNTGAAEFTRLENLAARYSLEIHFVPSYFRIGEYAAPAPSNSELTRALALFPRFHVAGPDYWLLPNRYFSDPVHLNREGAEFYTRKLALLLNKNVAQPQMSTRGSHPFRNAL